MAQVSSGSFVTNASEGRSLTFNWAVDSTNTSGNYKKIYWSLIGSGSAGGYVEAGNFKVVIDDETVYNSNNRIALYKGTVVASGYKTLYHDTNGNKSFSASVQASIYEYAVDNTGSGSWELPTIPRYFTSTPTIEFVSATETTANFKWTTSENCSKVSYSLDGVEDLVTVFDGTATTGAFSISGFNANTSHAIALHCVRKDSGLTSGSNQIFFATYNYPYCSLSPDFIIGNVLALEFYNPLGRSIQVKGYAKTDGREIFNGTTNGTQLFGFNDSNSVSLQYASIPNSQEGQYKVVVSYGDVSMTRDNGNVYKVRGNEIPTLNHLDYVDGYAVTSDITQNDTLIVQNLSSLNAMFDAATANYGAGSIAKYVLEINGLVKEVTTAGTHNLGPIDSARDVDLKLTAIDSRGLSASKTIKVTMVEYNQPTANVTLQRLNNYEDETYLTIDGSVSSVNNKNTMYIHYRYKAFGGKYGAWIVVNDGEKQTLQLDKNTVYIFNVQVIDVFNNTFDKEYQLDKGVFPLFINTVLNSVGVNKFPRYDKSLEAQGLVSLGERQVFGLGVGESVEIPIFLLLCSGLVNFRIAGANLEIARLFYVFRSNQYFGLHKTLIDESYGNTSAVVPMEMYNSYEGYVFKITNNHSSPIVIRYGILELC